MVHIDNTTYAEIAKAAIEAILNGERLDEVEVAGIVFLLDAKISKNTATAYTGVEFMGAREAYNQVSYKVSRVALIGAYDSEGEKIATDFSPVMLNLNYTDGCTTIAA